MRRRAFLKRAGVGALGLGLGMGLMPRRAHAAWGDVDATVFPPGSTPATSLLEIYLWGGMAPWESFYYRPLAGSTTRGFDSEVTALSWNTGVCPNTPAGLATQFLGKARNGAGHDVHLGPFAKPLFRSDIAGRTRVVVLQHDLAPHEAAIPYALSGRRLGRPEATGFGAPIQRRGRTVDPMNAHPLPFAYCMLPSLAIGNPMFSTLDAIGNHGGNSKPVVLPIGSSTASFIANLNRTMPAGTDDLLAQYTALYGNQLVPSGAPGRTRSAAFADYASSVAGLAAAPSLASLLGSAPLSAVSAPFCSKDTASFDTGQHFAGSALQTAAFLLNHPDPALRANYACVVDGGLQNFGFAYDVHNNAGDSRPGQAQRTSSNLWETLAALAGIIRQPGEAPSPLKIDLDTTLIVIKTEFGRTPFRSNGGAPSATSLGRDHWPDGYVNVLIGGPIHSAGVVGSIADGTGNAGQGVADPNFNYKPQDVQAAGLLAVGIDPFADGNLAMGDLTLSLQGATHADTAINLRQLFLGVS